MAETVQPATGGHLREDPVRQSLACAVDAGLLRMSLPPGPPALVVAVGCRSTGQFSGLHDVPVLTALQAVAVRTWVSAGDCHRLHGADGGWDRSLVGLHALGRAWGVRRLDGEPGDL